MPREGAQQPKAGPAPDSGTHLGSVPMLCRRYLHAHCNNLCIIFATRVLQIQSKKSLVSLLLPVCSSSVFRNNDQVKKSYGQMDFPGGPQNLTLF